MIFRGIWLVRAHLQNSGISTDEIAPALGPDPKARSIFGAQSMSLKRSEQPARDMKEKSERSKLIDLFTSSHKHKRKLHGNLLKYRQKFSGHSDGVWEVSSCQSPHFPNILCSASADGSVALWNNSTNASHSLIYKGHRGSVNSARFHPGNPRLLLTASGDLSFHVIRIPESFNYEFYSEDPAEYNPLYSRDGSRAQSEAEEKSPAFIPTKKEESKLEVPSPRTFEISDQKLIEVDQPFARVLNAHREPVSCAGWITNGEYIGTGSWDCNAAIWNLANGDIKEVHRLKGHEGRITNIDTIVDINCVLTSSTDHTFRLWDLRASSNAVNIFNGHSA